MPHRIPAFQVRSVGHGCEVYPGGLPTEDANEIEPLHKQLRTDAAKASKDEFELLICTAVQQLFDLLKQQYRRRGSAFNKYVLDVALLEAAFHLSLGLKWLPEYARADSPAWRQWIRELLEGRYSQVGLNDSCAVDPYMFIKFPLDGNTGSLPGSLAGSQTVTTGSGGGVKHVGVARFESVTINSRTKGGVKSPASKHKILEGIARGTAWRDVQLVVSHETLRIEVGGNATELGFLDAGFGKRDQKLELLTYFAASRGKLHDRFTFPNESKTPLKSVVSRLRRLLQNLIAIDGDPIEHRKKAGMYNCSFQIQNSSEKSFPTPDGATWLDFAFCLRGDGRLRVNVSARHSIRSLDVTKNARVKVESLPRPESAVSHIYSFEDLGLRTSASALTREGTAFKALLQSRGKFEAEGDDMAILELAQWLRTWTGLDGDPLQFAENSRIWTSSFECTSELNP